MSGNNNNNNKSKKKKTQPQSRMLLAKYVYIYIKNNDGHTLRITNEKDKTYKSKYSGSNENKS